MEKKLTGMSLGVNVLLLIAVAVLFFKVFSGKDEPATNQFDPPDQTGKSMNIAYINTDSVLSHYQLVQDLSDKLALESQKKDKDFSSKQKAFEADAAYFQEQVEKQTISNESAQAIYEQLMVKQQDLYELEQQYLNELAAKEMEMQQIILDSLRSKLTALNANSQYDYILSYNAMSNILIADDAFDITNIVIEKINEDFEE